MSCSNCGYNSVSSYSNLSNLGYSSFQEKLIGYSQERRPINGSFDYVGKTA